MAYKLRCVVSALTAACAAPAYSLRLPCALPLALLGGWMSLRWWCSPFGIVVIRGLGRSICGLACYHPVGLVICVCERIYSVICPYLYGRDLCHHSKHNNRKQLFT